MPELSNRKENTQTHTHTHTHTLSRGVCDVSSRATFSCASWNCSQPLLSTQPATLLLGGVLFAFLLSSLPQWYHSSSGHLLLFSLLTRFNYNVFQMSKSDFSSMIFSKVCTLQLFSLFLSPAKWESISFVFLLTKTTRVFCETVQCFMRQHNDYSRQVKNTCFFYPQSSITTANTICVYLPVMCFTHKLLLRYTMNQLHHMWIIALLSPQESWIERETKWPQQPILSSTQ